MADSSKSRTITTKQQQAITALLTARDVKAAAQTCGVGYRTLRGWLEQESFVAALRAAERELLDSTIRRLTALTGAAVETLKNEMANDDASSGERTRAADVVLKRRTDLKASDDLEQRMANLEALVGINQKGVGGG